MKRGIAITSSLLLILFIWAIRIGDSAKYAQGLVAASAVIAAAIFSTSITQHEIRAREISEGHRMRKIRVYEEFSDLYLATLKTAEITDKRTKLPAAQAAVVAQMYEFSKHAMLWASPEVLLAYKRWRECGQSPGSGAEIILRVDDVLQAMRTDLGLGNSGLKRGDLVKMYLRDPESLGNG